MEGAGRNKNLTCTELDRNYAPTDVKCTTENGGRFNISGEVVEAKAEVKDNNGDTIYNMRFTVQDAMPDENGNTVNRVYQSTLTSVGKQIAIAIWTASKIAEEDGHKGGLDLTFDFGTNKNGWAACWSKYNGEKMEFIIPFEKQRSLTKDEWVKAINASGDRIKAMVEMAEPEKNQESGTQSTPPAENASTPPATDNNSADDDDDDLPF